MAWWGVGVWASLLDREYSLITGGGGGQWVCCLAPVKVVSKEANGLIKLYSQYAPPGTLCNLLFNTPPPPTHTTLSLPVWLRCQFSWQLNAKSGTYVYLGVENEKRGRGKRCGSSVVPSLTQRGDEHSTSLDHML